MKASKKDSVWLNRPADFQVSKLIEFAHLLLQCKLASCKWDVADPYIRRNDRMLYQPPCPGPRSTFGTSFLPAPIPGTPSPPPPTRGSPLPTHPNPNIQAPSLLTLYTQGLLLPTRPQPTPGALSLPPSNTRSPLHTRPSPPPPDPPPLPARPLYHWPPPYPPPITWAPSLPASHTQGPSLPASHTRGPLPTRLPYPGPLSYSAPAPYPGPPPFPGPAPYPRPLPARPPIPGTPSPPGPTPTPGTPSLSTRAHRPPPHPHPTHSRGPLDSLSLIVRMVSVDVKQLTNPEATKRLEKQEEKRRRLVLN